MKFDPPYRERVTQSISDGKNRFFFIGLYILRFVINIFINENEIVTLISGNVYVIKSSFLYKINKFDYLILIRASFVYLFRNNRIGDFFSN